MHRLCYVLIIIHDGWKNEKEMVLRESENDLNMKSSLEINRNLYSASSRSLLRGAPEPGQAEKSSLEKVVENYPVS